VSGPKSLQRVFLALAVGACIEPPTVLELIAFDKISTDLFLWLALTWPVLVFVTAVIGAWVLPPQRVSPFMMMWMMRHNHHHHHRHDCW